MYKRQVRAVGGQGELQGVTRLPSMLETWFFFQPQVFGYGGSFVVCLGCVRVCFGCVGVCFGCVGCVLNVIMIFWCVLRCLGVFFDVLGSVFDVLKCVGVCF